MDAHSDLFLALGDATRLRLLNLLGQTGPVCVCELVDALRMPQYAVSRHLRALAAAGFVEDERRGKWVYYGIPRKLKPYYRLLLRAVAELRDEREDFAADEARAARRLKLRRDGWCCIGLGALRGRDGNDEKRRAGSGRQAPLRRPNEMHPGGSMSNPEASKQDAATLKKAVEEHYAAVARGQLQTCCNPQSAASEGLYNIATQPKGYNAADLAAIPEGADLGLGCGDPTANADLAPGQTVLDLGSGAGVDCFLAARRVGPQGRVIGVDMTDAMLEKARLNAQRGGFSNVEFRKGEIEALPVESGTIDRIISNCVINLAPDKSRVFREAYRVLKPGGAITVSDIVSFGDVPSSIRSDVEQWAGCTAGALDKQDYLGVIRAAGFREISVVKEVVYDYQRGQDYGFASVTVRATK